MDIRSNALAEQIDGEDFLVKRIEPVRQFMVSGASKKLGIRKDPTVSDTSRDQGYLASGEIFDVAEEVHGADGRRYFRLADGRGWVYDRSAKDINKIVIHELQKPPTLRTSMPGADISMSMFREKSVDDSTLLSDLRHCPSPCKPTSSAKKREMRHSRCHKKQVRQCHPTQTLFTKKRCEKFEG